MEKERREQAAKEKAESDKVIHKAIVNSVTMAELETFDYTQLLKWAKASANIDGVKGDFGGLLHFREACKKGGCQYSYKEKCSY